MTTPRTTDNVALFQPDGMQEERPAASAATPPSEWWLDQPLAQVLYALIKRCDLSDRALNNELARLEQTYGNLVYAEVIFLLTRVKLDPREARDHWQSALEHWAGLSESLGRPVDLRVALASYYLDVNRCLERPKIVEMDWVERATASAYIDELTGLPNYRFFREHLRREIERSRRDTSPLSLVLLDIDDFKLVNDRYGHEGGNRALAAIARTLRGNVRGGDVVARYGGEEFALLLPSTPKAEARHLADRLRFAVATVRIPVSRAGEPTPAVTVSVGVATCPGDAKSDTELIVCADRALYDAKASGKNQVRLFGGSSRSYARRRAAWTGHVRLLEPVARPIQTVEIGESGLSFVSDHEVARGMLTEVVVNTPNGSSLRIAGRVAWCRPLDDGRYEVAMRVVEHGAGDLEVLARWVSVEGPAKAVASLG